MPELSIIILTYNSSSYIKKCLESLLVNYAREIKDNKFELIIFDNASIDNSFQAVEKYIEDNFKYKKRQKIESCELYGKNFLVCKNDKNLGFSKGINKASSAAKGKVLLFLNPDTVLMDNKINLILDYLKNNIDVAIAGGKILENDGGMEPSAGKFYNLLNIAILSLGLENIFNLRFSPEDIVPVDFVSGGFMFVNHDIFDKLGKFDENFFMYVEDMELCFKAKKAGYKTMFLPYVAIKHYGQGSSDRTFAVVNIYKGLHYFYKKHGNKFSYFLVILILGLKAVAAIILGYLTGNRYLKITYSRILGL